MQEQESSAKSLGRRVRITVRGRLSERLASAFQGLTPVSGEGRTDLVGEVVDQAQLFGVLARIRDLGLELESVNPISDKADARSHSDSVHRQEA